MKIHADFYNVDDAERAAAALRASDYGIFDITVTDNAAESVNGNNADHKPYSMFTSLNGTTASTSFPVPNYSSDSNFENTRKGASIDVICRSIEGKRVRGVLINRGGHNLS